VVIGANVGTTMTGWIVALVGIKIQMGALAMPLIGVGMLTRLLGRAGSRVAGLGQALAGFGIFFLGIDALQGGFSGLTPLLDQLDLVTTGWPALAVFLGLGFGMTVITQSSSAAFAITLTGSVPLDLAAAAAIGTNIGTTSTAAFAAMSATPAAKRVATAHILFNIITAIAALILLRPLLAVSGGLAGLFAAEADMPATLAVFHTLFNVTGAVLIWPLVRRLTAYLRSIYVTPAEMVAVPRYLDRTLFSLPDLALRAMARELARMARMTFRLARDSVERPPALAQGAAQSEHDGLVLLGAEIRLFADQIAASGPSEMVAAGLQDLIRATQHLSELAEMGRALRNQPMLSAAPSMPEWSGLLDTTRICLTLRSKGEPQFLTPEEAAGLLDQIEDSYQAVKSRLLAAASVGAMPVTAMDQALTEAQAIRRMAAIALKAQRRLTPWSS
jgi:phosphate:Na+ symporter